MLRTLKDILFSWMKLCLPVQLPSQPIQLLPLLLCSCCMEIICGDRNLSLYILRTIPFHPGYIRIVHLNKLPIQTIEHVILYCQSTIVFNRSKESFSKQIGKLFIAILRANSKAKIIITDSFHSIDNPKSSCIIWNARNSRALLCRSW